MSDPVAHHWSLDQVRSLRRHTRLTCQISSRAAPEVVEVVDLPWRVGATWFLRVLVTVPTGSHPFSTSSSVEFIRLENCDPDTVDHGYDELVIRRCGQCPFVVVSACRHPGGPQRFASTDVVDHGPPPGDCPRRGRPLLLRVEGGP